MNKHLTIKNFGPIERVDMDILDYNIFIGPQATGKSTIAKMVYFFMSLKEDLVAYVGPYTSILDASPENFERIIRSKFSGFWGTIKVTPQFNVRFMYADGKMIELGCRDGFLSVTYSTKMENELNQIFQKVNKKAIHPNEVIELTKSLFCQDITAFYIPAGRSILSTLPDSIQQQILGMTSVIEKSDNWLLDLPLQNFLNQITRLKPNFNKPLKEVIENKQAVTPVSFELDTKSLEIVQQLILSILKGRYRYNKSGEVIDVDSDTSVKLSFASSGQQESLWILMQLFSLILDKTKSFVIIEEPEAHLFPEAQKYMTDLMSLIANVNGNQMMVTTHSPYILTSLNNHIYAEQVGGQHKDKASQIVDPALWMSHQRVNACYVDGGAVRSIMDEELRLIKAEEIDGASQIINNEFSRLADVE